MRLLVHEPMKTASTVMSFSGVPGVEVHVLEGALRGGALVRVGDARGVGNDVAERDALAGVGAPGDERLELVGVEEHLGVEHGALVGRQASASRRRRRPSPRPAGACARPFR